MDPVLLYNPELIKYLRSVKIDLVRISKCIQGFTFFPVFKI